ncbi:TPA: autotransporter domain-containing protein [Pseudomonas aeruginosa]
MKTTALKMTLLAASIAATTQAYAVPVTDLTQDISGGTEYHLLMTQANSVTLNGFANRLIGESGVSFQGVLDSNLTNNAAINVYSNSGIGLEVANTYDPNAVHTNISGNVINNGNVTIQGSGSTGIRMDGATAHSLINNGMISVTDLPGGLAFGTARGIEIENSNLNGDLINAGHLRVNGNGAKAIHVDQSTVGGNVENQASIYVTGDNASGIELNGGQFGHDLLNSSAVTVWGANAIGINVEDTSYNSIVNTGNIQAHGDNSRAIVVKDSSDVGTTGIVNSGTIMGDNVGIQIDSNDSAKRFAITQNGGLILGYDKSIIGNNQTDLQFNGGTIVGDIAGINTMQVGGDATFVGTDIDAKDVKIKNGQLSLSNLNTALTGNLSIDSGAAMQVRLSDSTDVAKPVVTVGGTASFAQGSKLNVTADPDDFTGTRQGTAYTLVSANQIENSGLSVESAAALLKIKSFKIGDQLVTAVVTGADGFDAQEILNAQGASRNAKNAVSPFADTVLGKMDSNDKVFQAFTGASDAELAKLSEQLAPQVNGGATHAAMSTQSLVNNAITSHLGASEGLSSGDVLKETGLWIKALHSDANQDRRNEVVGFDASTDGIIIGADGKLNDQTTIGLAYSYASTDVDSDDSNTTEVKSNALTAYSKWEQGPIFVDASLTYGKNDNESKRHIAGTTAKADYDSDLFGINVLGGYGFNVGDGYIVEPRAALRYSNLKIDGYNEKGSSAALSVDGQRIEVAELGAGVRFAKDFAISNGTLKPELTLMTYHDFAADQANTTSAFLLGGSPFVSNAAKPTRDSYEAGLGADYSVGAVTVGASYNYLSKADFDANTIVLKARYDF